jgi:hypothetical protein
MVFCVGIVRKRADDHGGGETGAGKEENNKKELQQDKAS